MRAPKPFDRRQLLHRAVHVGTAMLLPVRLRAAGDDALQTVTPPQTEGPFFPAPLPPEQDNDLVAVSGGAVTAQGVLANVTGRVLDERGRPVTDARVEIWQCDANGRYHHTTDRRDAPFDDGFQGYGQFITRADGRYLFRTIRPVPYPGRTPHIHFKISGPGFSSLTTQMYVAGEPSNARDFVLNRIRDERQRRAVIVDFLPDSIGGAQQQANFDIVLAADGRFVT